MRAPTVIRTVLDTNATAVLGRVALTAAYGWSGVSKLAHFGDAIAEVRHFGLEPATFIAALTILVQIGGSVLVIAGRAVWLGAGALAVFTLLATIIAHAFWSAPAADRALVLNTFLEHIGLIGGFVLTAILMTPPQAERSTRT